MKKKDLFPELYTEICGYDADAIQCREYHYHESCRSLLLLSKESSSSKDLSSSSSMQKAFKRLINMIERRIINQGAILKMKDIVELFSQYKEEENETLEGLLTKNVKSRLVNYFGKKLSFWAPPGKGELVLSNENPTEKAFEWGIEKPKGTEIKNVANEIREELLDLPKTFKSWPPSVEELSMTEIQIPSKLECFLINVLSHKGKTTERISRLVKSIGQDLIYNTTRGKNRQLKHVQLGLNLKRKTGKRLINIC